eukprot:215365-Alexandrium_andersonii.AAC.1
MQLEEVYTAIFQELRTSGLKRLRLLPISGGIFSGHLATQIPSITFKAMMGAYEKLDQSVQTFLRSVSIELCVYRRDQVE